MPGNLPQRGGCGKGNWPDRWSLLAVSCRCYWVRPGLKGDYALFPSAAAGQPTPAPREPSPGIRASLPTRAKFFRHERSCRSPRGDTQLLRLSAILVSTFYPPGHCYAWSEADACNCGGIFSLEEFAVGAPLISWRACPERSL